MADIHDKATRSYNMSRIRNVDTKPEMLVRKFLYANGFRYRLHNKKLYGKPDLTLTKYQSVIFVNGCFWHGHKNCKYFVVPKTRRDFWIKKIETNKLRDKKNKIKLKKEGWNVIEIYECELKKISHDQTLNKLTNKLNKLNLN